MKKNQVEILPKITNHLGGINFVIGAMEKMKINKIIDKECGKRVNQANYSFADTILGFTYTTFCGEKYIEKINEVRPLFWKNPKQELVLDSKSRGDFSSPDMILRVLKRFAIEPIRTPLKDKDKPMTDVVNNEICENKKFQNILMKICKKLGMLTPGTNYTLDYDTVVIPTEKKDARMTYKKFVGYHPAIAVINKMPVYIQGRNGNTAPSHEVQETLEKIFNSLKKDHDIDVNRVRMDAASYIKDVMRWLDKQGKEFFIRTVHSPVIYDDIKLCKWKPVFFENQNPKMKTKKIIRKEVSHVEHSFDHKKAEKFRIVFLREPDKNGKLHEHTQEPFNYTGIITNNWTMTDEEVVRFYNKRGDTPELDYRRLLNDFHFKRLPCSNLAPNLVFMYIGAINKVIYEYLHRNFSAKFTKLKRNVFLQTFIDIFIKVNARWVQKNGKWIFQIESPDYDRLYGFLNSG